MQPEARRFWDLLPVLLASGQVFTRRCRTATSARSYQRWCGRVQPGYFNEIVIKKMAEVIGLDIF
jgi:hypothetical protein